MSAAPQPNLPQSPAPEPPLPEHSPISTALVRLMIFVTALMVITMVAILTARWLTVDEPTSIIYVAGSPALGDHTEVRVEGFGIKQPLSAVLDKENDYHLRFFLQPGNYVVRVLRDKQEVYRQEVVVQENEGRQLDLPGVLPVTRPAPRLRSR